MVLQGLLLDSGDTLMRPRGGRWNPRFDFEAVVARHVGELEPAELREAFAVGDRYLEHWQAASAELGPAKARAEYHRTILEALGVDDPAPALLEELDRPRPFTEIVEPFADTAVGLSRLHADGWRIAVVADTTPAMVDVYRALGLDRLIDTYVISGELGFSKPDPRMYRTASDRLGLHPADCVFVDDDPGNLDGAEALGYHVCGMSRYGEAPGDARRWVQDLEELRRHLALLRQHSRPFTPPGADEPRERSR